MIKHLAIAGLATIMIYGVTLPCRAACEVGRLAQLPVTIEKGRAIVPAQINGEDVTMVIDSGAFYSILSEATAKHANLPIKYAPFGLTLRGINGSTQASVGTVNEFKLANLVIPKIQFLVGGTDIGAGASGVIGQNILGWKDVEYDLGNGVIRLFRLKDCGKQPVAYWVKTETLSMIDIESLTQARFHTLSEAYLNGRKIRVAFDTGFPKSTLVRRAAERAGFKVDGADVKPLGPGFGWGHGWFQTWAAKFDSFKLGNEEIRNARLRVGDFSLEDVDMWLGLDFFLSHRIYVSNDQKRMYFTYNGGPVFDLSAAKPKAILEPAPAEGQTRTAEGQTAPEGGQSPPTEGQTAPPAAGTDTTDAAEYSRRGMAQAARHDFAQALENLKRACELAPQESTYFFQRGLIEGQSGDAATALKDFDQALNLKPDNLDALMARMQLRRRSNDLTGATSDLDAAANAAAKEAQVRFDIAANYEGMQLYRQAIAQYDLWVAVHPDDARLLIALNNRCWARAMLNEELEQALSDCNRALSLNSKAYYVLDSRGLVELRLGKYQKAIADYNKLLSTNPNSAWPLYGRGIAKLRLGQNSEGQADIAAAEAKDPKLLEMAAKFGVTP